LVVLERGRSR